MRASSQAQLDNYMTLQQTQQQHPQLAVLCCCFCVVFFFILFTPLVIPSPEQLRIGWWSLMALSALAINLHVATVKQQQQQLQYIVVGYAHIWVSTSQSDTTDHKQCFAPHSIRLSKCASSQGEGRQQQRVVCNYSNGVKNGTRKKNISIIF